MLKPVSRLGSDAPVCYFLLSLVGYLSDYTPVCDISLLTQFSF
jgi:hypothetical protein